MDKKVQRQWQRKSVGAAKCFEQVIVYVDMGLFKYNYYNDQLITVSVQIAENLQKSRMSKTWFMVKVKTFDDLLLLIGKLKVWKF